MSQPVLRLALPLACMLTLAVVSPAQEPEPAPVAPAARPEPSEPAPPAERAGDESVAAPATPQAKVTVIRAGHVHPVSSAAIENGVIVITDDRITAIGPADAVPVPEGAEVREFPTAHVYPGLVDALTDAFVDEAMRDSAAVDASTELAGALGDGGDREDDLLRAGITTAYVGNQSSSVWRGVGVVVRPMLDSCEVFAGHDRAGVQLRATNGPNPSHALERRAFVESALGVFKSLTAYKESFDKHKEALEKYEKDFAAYLDYHEKKNGKKGDETPAAPAEPAGDQPAGARRGRAGEGRGRRGRPGGGEPGGGQPGGGQPGGGATDLPEAGPQDPKPPSPPDPKPQDPKPQDPKPAEAKPQEPGSQQPGQATEQKPAEPKPPERPKYPKEPDRDPVKDTLIEVQDGKLPLRAEVHRPDEILTLLQTASEREIQRLVLEEPIGAATVVAELAAAGIPCVLTGLWPQQVPDAYEGYDAAALPAVLQAHGVAFALATGSGRRADALPMLAAIAVGHGLEESAALRAITLTPAEILGVQADTGSLQQGKLADLLVCDRPLLQSDCRLLAVMSAGEIRFEAEEKR